MGSRIGARASLILKMQRCDVRKSYKQRLASCFMSTPSHEILHWTFIGYICLASIPLPTRERRMGGSVFILS